MLHIAGLPIERVSVSRNEYRTIVAMIIGSIFVRHPVIITAKWKQQAFESGMEKRGALCM